MDMHVGVAELVFRIHFIGNKGTSPTVIVGRYQIQINSSFGNGEYIQCKNKTFPKD